MPDSPIETEGLIACIAILFIYCEEPFHRAKEAVVSRSMGPPSLLMVVDSNTCVLWTMNDVVVSSDSDATAARLSQLRAPLSNS